MPTVNALPDLRPAALIFDPNAAPPIGVDLNTSLAAQNVEAVSISSVGSGVSITIQGRAHPAAAWTTILTVTGATEYYQQFNTPVNMLQVLIPATIAGTLVHAQIAPEGV